MTIKHLVLSGGGMGGFTVYGALKYLNQNSFFLYENIKSIHATSAGSIIGGLFMLSREWDILDDYLLKRPWNKLINVDPIALLNIWQEKGILNEYTIKEILSPFLKINNFSANITLKELYDKNNIEFYVYSTNINSDDLENQMISYKTYPNLEFSKAICMSSAYPLIFEPIYDNSNCYIDGGLLNNFPLNDCIKLNPNTDEILGINIESIGNSKYVVNDTILPLYLYTIIAKMHTLINKNSQNQKIKHLVNCKIENNTLYRWSQALADFDVRDSYINIGITNAKDFLVSMDY